MAPAESQDERNDLKMVSPDSLLMKIPQVTREEWEAASKTYFNEAQQIALRLPEYLADARPGPCSAK